VASGTGEDPRYPDGTLRLQIPYFLERGLDLRPFHNGTLNLDLAPRTFRLTNPEWSFAAVEWTNLHPPENFRFSRICIGWRDQLRPGLIYSPDPATKAAHEQPPTVMEILAPTLPGIGEGSSLVVWTNPAEVIIDSPAH